MADLRSRVASILEAHWKHVHGGAMPAVGDDDNLFDREMVDSMTMLEIVTVVEEHTGSLVDFLEVDPELFFTIRGILEYAAKEMAV